MNRSASRTSVHSSALRSGHQTVAGKTLVAIFSFVASVLFAASAQAQQAPTPTPQFDMLGFIQSATVDDGSMCPGVDPILVGGTVTLNGITMTVPCNTILQMPATWLTWAQLFDPTISAPVNAVPLNGTAPNGQSGLALADNSPFPYPSFEIRVVGNVVRDAAGNKQYIAGLISPVSQQGLNAGQGEITCIDYTNGFIYVGGATARAGESCSAANGARLQMNDPIGRWGTPHSPDARFTGDTGNTTMHTDTGYPICVPRSDPAFADDLLCPKGNRPFNRAGSTDPLQPYDPFIADGAPLKSFDMPAPADNADGTAVYPDARQQLPLMIGDWIAYSGTLAKDALGFDYISAHTIVANLGIFTAPFSQPSYIALEGVLLGTGGEPIPGIAQEATNRIFVVGFTTDPTSLVEIDAVDVNPCTGQESLRMLGVVDPAAQPVRGRFRFHVLGGAFMPPTREMLVQTLFTPMTPGSEPGGMGYANGLGSGSYRAPNFDFIFPEGFKFGQPLPPNNFQDLPFLARGSGPLGGVGPVVGQLTPWPGSQPPVPAKCNGGGTAPMVNLGPDITVGAGVPVSLFATVTEDPNAFSGAKLAWRQTNTVGPFVTLIGVDTLTPMFVAPTVGFNDVVTLTFELTATDDFGSTTATVNVTVLAATDLVSGVTAVWRGPRAITGGGGLGGVRGQKGGKLTVTATSSVIQSNVTLTVVGFGGMQNLGAGNYTLNATGVGFAPETVTIRSSLGGQATVPVTLR